MDVAAGPAVGLGRRIRQLRRERGLSQRQLTRLIGLSAHSNLADYEAGRRVPPQDVVAACERALHVEDAELTMLRRRALAHRDAEVAAPATALPPPPPTRPGSRARRAAYLAVAAGFLAAAVLVAAHLDTGAGRAAAHDSTTGLSSCDRSAYIIDTVALDASSQVADARPGMVQGTPLGQVALRYSPTCALAWTRFVPTGRIQHARATLVLQTHRVNDGADSTLRLAHVVAAESDPLLTVPGCVYAQATVTFAGGPSVTGRTSCFQRG